ncbi:sucrose-phosphate synthase 4-like [Argentina anserina]|uniref:sucrose-phosphate synthase 4-like n=1 Tax=Argentina anserina TaxID=57926 RepID=UPI0021769113|nr:sucrose-phosphate synthase 4-like [Potentilla anserina]
MVPRLAISEGGAEDDITEYGGSSSSRCYSYNVKPGAEMRGVDDLRQRLRMRGFRCNLFYTRVASRLNVVPLFASRVQALRYLSVRWGTDLSKVVVFVGEEEIQIMMTCWLVSIRH